MLDGKGNIKGVSGDISCNKASPDCPIEEDEQMVKKCKFVRILTEDESAFIIILFKNMKFKGPIGKILGRIDIKESECSDCPHLYSFGYAYYCDNQPVLEKCRRQYK